MVSEIQKQSIPNNANGSEVQTQGDSCDTPVSNDDPPFMSPRVVSEKRTASGRIVKPPIRLSLKIYHSG